LASIHSEYEYAAVLKNLPPGNSYWIGYNAIKDEKDWVWNDYSAKDFTAWAPGQPGNNGSDEDCAAIYFDRKWHDINCMAEHEFVCKRDIGAKPRPRPRAVPTSEVKEKVKYVLSSSKADWFNAHRTCVA
jgi:hypothetical protein